MQIKVLDDEKVMTMIRDPVCGMNVDEQKAPFTEVDGRIFFFCCEGCKETFKRNPRKWS
jgi:YHS domain-containing protein